MSGGPSFGDAFGTDSRCYERYTAVAAAELSSNDDLSRAKAAWQSFVVEGHGDVFGRLESDPSDLFVDALYLDFVVDRLIDRFEHRVGVELHNRSAADNTDALPFEFHALHDPILAAESRIPSIEDVFDRTDPVPSGSAAGLLRELYESVVSTDLRRLLGEYYTPRGIADLAVRELDIEDAESETMLDPGCGSGIFLASCIDAKLSGLGDELAPETVIDTITNTVYGIDLNPLAVKTAKLVYLHALEPAIEASTVDRVKLPVFLTDSLGLTREDEIEFDGEPLNLAVDHLVGNPPWLTWGALDESIRDAWRATHVDRLDLIPHRGIESRLGHGNDDVSIPFVWVWIDRYLVDGGDASFVLKRDIRSGPAGRLLRRGRVGARPVAVRHVHDFGRLRPFEDVAVNAAVYSFDADRDNSFPIPMDRWTQSGEAPSFATVDAMAETLDRDDVGLVPVDDTDPASSWIATDAARRAHGECTHEIRHGVKDDASDVYTIERDQLRQLEHDHVYPYLRSKHVVKYGLFGHDLQLVPMRKADEENEAELRAEQPETYAYLDRNRERLEARSSTWLDSGPFYNLFGLGPYTWSEYKVVWCRLGFKPHFAVVSTVDDPDLGEKTVVPGDHCMFVPTDDEYEAHFLCGLLNSAAYQRSLDELASEGKASLSKSVVSELRLPEYRGTDLERRLAEHSMAAHRIVPEYTNLSKRTYNDTEIEELSVVQAEIDDLVERYLSNMAPAVGGD